MSSSRRRAGRPPGAELYALLTALVAVALGAGVALAITAALAPALLPAVPFQVLVLAGLGMVGAVLVVLIPAIARSEGRIVAEVERARGARIRTARLQDGLREVQAAFQERARALQERLTQVHVRLENQLDALERSWGNDQRFLQARLERMEAGTTEALQRDRRSLTELQKRLEALGAGASPDLAARVQELESGLATLQETVAGQQTARQEILDRLRQDVEALKKRRPDRTPLQAYHEAFVAAQRAMDRQLQELQRQEKRLEGHLKGLDEAHQELADQDDRLERRLEDLRHEVLEHPGEGRRPEGRRPGRRGRTYVGPQRSPFGEVHAITSLEAIPLGVARDLQEAGIRDTQDLWHARPERVAQVAGVPVREARRWQHMAALMAVEEIGPRPARLLAESGITSIQELGALTASELVERMQARWARGHEKEPPLDTATALRLIEAARDHRPVRSAPAPGASTTASEGQAPSGEAPRLGAPKQPKG